MQNHIRNTNLRFNLEKDLQRKAWEYLQSMNREEFKSYSHAISLALVDYFDRYYGKKIIASRKNFVGRLNDIVHGIHKKISGGKEELFLSYEPDVGEMEFEEELLRNQEKDLKFGMTSVGPHRDDMCFLNHGIDIRRFGSQGQQRSCALSLKLSEIELVKSSINETPVLILDDVLSELDSSRQNFLLNSIHDIQAIITCTGLDEFVKNRFEINKVFKVVNGTVKAENSF